MATLKAKTQRRDARSGPGNDLSQEMQQVAEGVATHIIETTNTIDWDVHHEWQRRARPQRV
jgi:hypothetical protein